MAVLRQRHSCRERRRFVRPVPELCLLQGVYPDEAQVCRAGLPASSHPAKRVFLVRDIAGEDRVPPGDQVSDRERAKRNFNSWLWHRILLYPKKGTND